jgi:Leucine-rich repeat (LRR) protein
MKKFTFFLLFSILGIGNSMGQSCRLQDSLELVAFFDSTNGTRWLDKTNWKTNNPLNTWYGIRTNAAGCVTCIDLDGAVDCSSTSSSRSSTNNLRGSLYNFNLPYLEHLSLAGNYLSGTIPNFNLPNLKVLSLQANQLTGTIPNFNFPNLRYLDLGNNQLSGDIPNFNFPNLLELSLHANALTGTIPNFNFPNLKGLYLSINNLTGGIPNFNFSNLEVLSFYSNQLTGNIPNFNYAYLNTISLQSNRLTGTIPNFNLPNLRALYLGNNNLSGCIPSGIRDNCILLGNGGGGISGNPSLSNQDWLTYWTLGTGMCLPPRAETLNASQCGTRNYRLPSGRIVNTIGTYLDTFRGITQDVYYTVRLSADMTCRCQDSIQLVSLYNATQSNPTGWIRRDNWLSTNPINRWYGITLNAQGCVDSIYLDNNRLNGTVPNLQLPNLRALGLNNNQLTGNIPNFNMPLLKRFGLATNQLTGKIPNFNLPVLTSLYLQNNQLTDTIPNFNLPDLIQLQLNNNLLTGNIPNFNLPQLQGLYLHNNQLIGRIPNFNFRNLINLQLNNNRLIGKIPNFNSPLLQTLYLNNNQLTDTIPNFNFRNLRDLQLNDNQLMGKIPILNFIPLQTLYFNNNQLTDTVPNFNLPNLIDLRFNNNLLTGTIPNFNLPLLQNLYLNQNQLTGAIPNFSFPQLTDLKLHNNQLTGNIPNFNLARLTLLYLSDNQLTGCIPAGIKTNCPLIGANNGNIANNPTLATQNWASYWNQGNGSCRVTDAGGAITDVLCTNRTYRLPSGRIVNAIGTYADTIKNTGFVHDIAYTVRLTTDLGCRCQDSLQLVRLYEATHGSNWTNQWIQQQPIDATNWQGVVRNANYCVTSVDLHGNNLSNDSLDNLPNLQLAYIQNLNLAGNQLKSRLPAMDSMPNLLQLNLQNNQFWGPFPNLNIPNLRSLNLSKNRMDRLRRLTALSSLQNLNITENRLTFDGVLPNLNLNNGLTYSYANQAKIYRDTVFEKNMGAIFSVNLGIDDTVRNSTYTWSKTGMNPIVRDSNKLVFNGLRLSDTGVYTCAVTNALAPQLTLYSYRVTIRSKCALPIHHQYPIICQGTRYTLPNTQLADTTGDYPSIFQGWLGCDSIVMTHLKVNPKHQLRDTVYNCAVSLTQDTVLNLRNQFGCDSIVHKTILPGKKWTELPIQFLCEPANLTPRIRTLQTWNGCDSVVIQRFQAKPSYHLHQYRWVCDITQVRAQSDTFPTTIYRCDSIITTHYQLANKDYLLLPDTVVRRQTKAVVIKIDSFKNQYGCDSIRVRKWKLQTQQDSSKICDRQPGIDTVIKYHRQGALYADECDTVFLMRYTFDACDCFKKTIVYNRMITNDLDTMNNFLFMKNHELYPPLDLVILDKRGIVLYESPQNAPFKNDWDGKDRHGNQLPAGIYNYILRIRQQDLPCVRMGVLDIKYID